MNYGERGKMGRGFFTTETRRHGGKKDEVRRVRGRLEK